MLLSISREMNQYDMIYHRLINKWLRTVEVDKAEHEQCIGCFREELAKRTGMQIDYDSDMGLVLAKLVREAYRDSHGRQLNPKTSWLLNNLLHIMRTLYQHLFIGPNDVREILEHISIKQAQTRQFLESEVMPVEIRWDSCVPYEIELFRFIAPFKGISRSLQVAIDDRFKRESYLPQRFEEPECPSWLKQSKTLQERIREQNEDEQKTKESINQPQSTLRISSIMSLDLSVISNHEEECSQLFFDLDE